MCKNNTTVIKVLRFCMSWIFLWAFMDKLLGLGFATNAASAWIQGGSPTSGFLLHATKGPLTPFFQAMANSVLVDVLFMFGLLGTGLLLLHSRWVKYGAYIGICLMALMYLALLLPTHNPLVDDHIIYILVLCLISNESKNVSV